MRKLIARLFRKRAPAPVAPATFRGGKVPRHRPRADEAAASAEPINLARLLEQRSAERRREAEEFERNQQRSNNVIEAIKDWCCDVDNAWRLKAAKVATCVEDGVLTFRCDWRSLSLTPSESQIILTGYRCGYGQVPLQLTADDDANLPGAAERVLDVVFRTIV